MKVIVDIKAGLGNQLFCYAIGYAIAQKTGADLYIETSVLDRKRIKDRNLEILKFRLPYKKRISFYYTYNPFLKKMKLNRFMKRMAIGLKTDIYKEKDKEKYDEGVFQVKKDTYFDGYWQHYRYFHEYRQKLLEVIQPVDKESIKTLEEEIRKTNAVSIHIRRGDYVSAGWEIPMDYYLKALQLLKGKVKTSELIAYVFSDDIEFAKEFFDKNPSEGFTMKYMEYTSEDKVVHDMYLMSCCKHNIIANSTFSWWGAYLNNNREQVVVCPEIGKWNENFYLPEWNRIKV